MLPRPTAPRRAEVDDVVRRAILRGLETIGVSSQFVIDSYVLEGGYGSIQDALAGTERRHQLAPGELVGMLRSSCDATSRMRKTLGASR